MVSNSARRSMFTGCSGMTQRSAAPAIVGKRAVNPAYRPNTSITRKRSCEPADVRALVVQSFPVAQGVVAADRDQHVDPEMLEVLEDILRDVVDRLVVPGEMRGQAFFRQVTRADAGGVEKGAAGAPDRANDRLAQRLDVVAVVRLIVAHVVDESAPTMSNPDHLVAIALGTDRDGPDSRVQAGDIPAACQNRDGALPHVSPPSGPFEADESTAQSWLPYPRCASFAPCRTSS